MKAKWPSYLLIFFIFLIPLVVSPATFDQYGTPKLALFIFLCGFLSGIIIWRSRQLQQLPKSVLFMMGFFLLVQFGEMIRLPAPWSGFFGEYGQSDSFLAQIGFILIFLGGYLLLDHDSVLIFFRRVTVLAVTIISLYGLYEYFWGDPVTHLVVTRVRSFLGDPNSLGVFLVLTLPLLYWELETPSSRSFQILCCAAIFLGSASLLLTFSRAAWLGFLVSLFFFILTSFNFLKKNRLPTILILSLLIIGLLAGEVATRFQFKTHSDYDLPARINSVVRGNDSGRRLLWPIAWQIFKTSPLSGYGFGTFQDNFHRYQTIPALQHWGPERDLREAHNETLQYLASQGLAGLLSYYGFIFSLCFAIWPRKFQNRPANDKRTRLLTALAAAITGYLIFMQFAYPLIHYSCIFWLYWGIMLRSQEPETTSSGRVPLLNSSRILLIGVLFGGAVWLSFRIYQADVYYQHAFHKSHVRKYENSLTYFAKIIGLNPWMYQYRYRQAITYIRAARRSDRTYQSALSRHYLNQALSCLDQLALSYPERYQISYLRGRIYEYTRQDMNASQLYRNALHLFPTNYKLWFRLAITEIQQGHQAAALSAWHAGIKINRPYMLGRLKLEHLNFVIFQ